MHLRSLHQLLVLQMWVIKRKECPGRTVIFNMSLAKTKWPTLLPLHVFTPFTARANSCCQKRSNTSQWCFFIRKTSPAVISNSENRIVTVISSRNRLTCTADYFVQWRSCRGRCEPFCLWQITAYPFHQGLSRKDKIFILHVDWKSLLQEKYERDLCALWCRREQVHRLSCCSLVNPLWDFCQTLFMLSRMKGWFCCFPLKDLHNL